MKNYRNLGLMWLVSFITVYLEVYFKMIKTVEEFAISNFVALFVLFCIWLICYGD